MGVDEGNLLKYLPYLAISICIGIMYYLFIVFSLETP